MVDPRHPDESAPASPAGDDTARPPLPRWKRVLLITAGVFVAAGLALLPFETGGADGDLSTSGPQQVQGPGSEQAPNTPGGLQSGFDAGGPGTVPGGTGGEPGTDPAAGDDEDRDLSPVFLKLGFSFFVGFAVGYAFRAFVKLAMIFVGLQLLTLFGLSYVDWVTVNWETMAAAWDHLTAGLGDEFENFRSFISGSLPQAGLATLGLFAGFKKH